MVGYWLATGWSCVGQCVQILYSWITPLVWYGCWNPLNFDSVEPVATELTAPLLIAEFNRNYAKANGNIFRTYFLCVRGPFYRSGISMLIFVATQTLVRGSDCLTEAFCDYAFLHRSFITIAVE